MRTWWKGIAVALCLLAATVVPASAQAQRKGWLIYNRVEDQAVRICMVRTDGKDAHGLDIDNGFDPSFTPDGHGLVYTRILDKHAGTELVVQSLDKKDARVVLNVADFIFGPCMSPDGSRIAYCLLSNKGKSRVYVIDAKGGEPRAVGPEGALAPRWSPDGKQIAFSWYDEDRRKVGVGLVDSLTPGAAHHNVVEGAGPVVSLAWSPDGKRIAYVQTDGTSSGDSFVRMVDVDGRNDKNVTPAKGTRVGVEFSDDGKSLFTSYLDIPAKQSGLACINGDTTTRIYEEKGGLCMMNGGFALIWLAERASMKSTPTGGTAEPKK